MRKHLLGGSSGTAGLAFLTGCLSSSDSDSSLELSSSESLGGMVPAVAFYKVRHKDHWRSVCLLIVSQMRLLVSEYGLIVYKMSQNQEPSVFIRRLQSH